MTGQRYFTSKEIAGVHFDLDARVLRGDALGCFRQTLGVATDEEDIQTLSRQLPRNRQSDAVRGARYNGPLTVLRDENGVKRKKERNREREREGIAAELHTYLLQIFSWSEEKPHSAEQGEYAPQEDESTQCHHQQRHRAKRGAAGTA